MNMSTTQEMQPETLVVGLGVTGLSVLRFLRARGVAVAVTDSRRNPPSLEALRADKALADVPTFLGGFDKTRFGMAPRIIVSPGVPLDEPMIVAARARGLRRSSARPAARRG